MSAGGGDGAAYAADFEAVAAAEAAWIAARREAAGSDPDGDTVGLAFSGGGIRSATFNLGVLEALDEAGLMRDVDYLSSVSGGGYIAGCYAWLRSKLPPGTAHPFRAPLPRGGVVVDWLRRHGRFLVAARGYSLWTLFASILAATFLNLLVLGPVVVLVVYAMTLGWLPLQWPDWLGRFGLGGIHDHHGYLLLIGAGLAGLAAFPVAAVVFGLVAGVPRLGSVRWTDGLRVLMGRLLGGGIALLAVGLIPVVHAAGEAFGARFESDLMHLLGRHVVWFGPMVSGLLAMLGGRRSAGPLGRQVAMLGLALVVYGLLVFAYHLAEHIGVVQQPWFAEATLLSLLLAFVCNINRISMHAYYRARLSAAFLPPLAGQDDAHASAFRLDAIGPGSGTPFPLLNTTLNTTSSPDQKRHGREGASFFLSPLYCGATATGYARASDYADGSMALSTAMTTSGAAIDPDTQGTRSRAVSSLMALLNIRLGYWADNPAHRARAHWPLPWWWILIGREMLGIGLDERQARIHLSDGGHFENLGLYELVRRRVRHIVVTDAGADPGMDLSDLGRAIERVRVDFGAEVALDAADLVAQRAAGRVTRPWLLGSVRYADGSSGRVLYIKPLQVAGATADLYAYARANPAFPDQPTSNQFFGEAEFEAYRVLGNEIVRRMLGEEAPADVPAWFDHLQALGPTGS